MQTQHQGPGGGTLIIENNDIASSVNTDISSNCTDAVVGDVLIRNKATLSLLSNQVLTVNGSFSNGYVYLSAPASTLQFAGTNPATIYGSQSNANFVCIATNGGKTLYFQAGSTNTLLEGLTLKGDPTTNLLLRSTADGSYWNLGITGVVVQAVDYVDVRDSRAGVKFITKVTATHSLDSGHNTNWVFSEVGLTNTWIGTSNTTWSASTNWSLGRAPIDSDLLVLIPGGKPRYPLLDTDRSLPALTIESGGAMSLNGNNLIVVSNTVVAGTLTAAGAETLTFLGNVDFTGGTFTQAQSTAFIGGVGPQSVTSAGQQFYKLTVTNASGSVMFVDAMKATQYRSMSVSVAYGGNVSANDVWVYSDSGSVTQTFASGSACTVNNFYFLGGAGRTQVLRSSAAGAWSLTVSNFIYAKYVDVQNSDALGGLPVYAVSSTDSGSNPNWVFDAPWKVWTGSVSTSFTNDNNWSPVGAPTATDYVLIDDPHLARLTATTTVSRLVIGGSTQATLEANAPLTALNEVLVLAGGVLNHGTNAAAPTLRMNLSVPGTLTVAAEGTIDATGKGYPSCYGPGTSSGGVSGNNKRSGAGYGGKGGQGTGPSPSSPGETYGSVTWPTNWGSGGADSSYSRGGGVVLLTVGGMTRVDGSISANGTNTNVGANSGGAGGSVVLTTSNLVGSGTIQANGGVGYSDAANCGSGGGGRLAVLLTGSSSFGGVNLRALGGSGGTPGAAGTVYTRIPGQGLNAGTLTVANNGMSANRNTEISIGVIDAIVGDVVIANGATLHLNTNQSLTVNGSFSNGNAFVSQPGSTLLFAGTNTGVIYGNQTMANLICTNANKTLHFQAGRTNTVEEALRLTGDGVNKLVLRSTADGSAWYLSLSPMAGLTVDGVDVKDSHADAGYGTLIAATASIDSGNNTNWSFASVGLTNTWIGAVDTDWVTPGNWDQNRAPIPGDVAVVISNGCAFYPVLATDRTVPDFVMRAGSAFNLNGQNLTVTGDATIGGTLAASGPETVWFAGNVDFTGGGLVPAVSTQILNGVTVQSVVSDGVHFKNLIVSNTAATVTFADAMSADYYRCASASVRYEGGVSAVDFVVYSDGGSVTQTFAAATTSTVQNLYLYGTAGKTQVLRSAGGGAWRLTVLDVAFVRYADVADSDASGGKTIHPHDSFDAGGNTNWVFDTVWKTWTGNVDTNFMNANNWSPIGAPSSADFVLIDATNLAVLSAPATVYHLQLGGITAATLRANAALIVLEDLQLLAGGVLTHGSNTTAETYKLNVSVTGNVTVAAGARIDANSLGFRGGSGPGAGTLWSGGGSYGGQGGLARDGQAPGPTYGSITSPTNIGSGGATNQTGTSGSGGGAVRLIVAGTTRLDGTIRANGRGTGDRYYGGGSGGSVWITTSNLFGAGSIGTIGGNATYSGEGVSGGGGGRIAVHLTASDDFGSVTFLSYGGTGTKDHGAAGTIYLQGQSDSSEKGILIADNNGRATRYRGVTDLSGVDSIVFAPRGVLLRNSALLGISSNDTLTLTNTVVTGVSTNGLPGLCLNGGRFVVPPSFTLSNLAVLVDVAASEFNPAIQLTVGEGGVLEINVPYSITGTVKVAAGGLMRHRQNTTNEAYKLNLAVVGDLTVSTGGMINVTGLGCLSDYGLGKPTDYRSGGSHGGLGGTGGSGYPTNTYGSFLAPTNTGSGGGGGGYYGVDSGGGAVRLDVTGTTTVDGLIAADGTNEYIQGNSGGSGGSIYLTTAWLAGSGTIRANGSAAWDINGYSGAGGGGRVSVNLTCSEDFGAVILQARGGSNGNNSGGAGTVYRAMASQGSGRGTVTIDNSGLGMDGYAELPGRVTPGLSNELDHAILVLTNTNTRLALTAPATVGNLVLYTTNASCLTLGSWDLTVNVSEHPLSALVGKGPGATNRVDHYTQILWNPKRGTVYGFR
jgi:hypothetical protein